MQPNDLIPFQAERASGVFLLQDKTNGLLFADDAALLSGDTLNMEYTLQALNEYCTMWDLEVNNLKTKTTWSSHQSFYYNGVVLEDVKTYKYLVFVISNTGDLSYH